MIVESEEGVAMGAVGDEKSGDGVWVRGEAVGVKVSSDRVDCGSTVKERLVVVGGVLLEESRGVEKRLAV